MIPDKRIIELVESSKTPMIHPFNKTKSTCLNGNPTVGLLSYAYQPTVEHIQVNGLPIELKDLLDSQGRLHIPARARLTLHSQETFQLPNNIMTVVLPIDNCTDVALISQNKLYFNGTHFHVSMTYFNMCDEPTVWNSDCSFHEKSFCHMMFFENISPLLDDAYQPIHGF